MTTTRRMTPIHRFYNEVYMLGPGSCLVDDETGCRIRRNYLNDSFVMTSPDGGRHELDIDNTSPERLMAHWKGFKTK